jgi:hypothetical protein
METFTKHAMPMYTHDQDVYIRQMYDWHMKIVQYHGQLRAHHFESSKHFQKLVEETAKKVEIPSKNSAA